MSLSVKKAATALGISGLLALYTVAQGQPVGMPPPVPAPPGLPDLKPGRCVAMVDVDPNGIPQIVQLCPDSDTQWDENLRPPPAPPGLPAVEPGACVPLLRPHGTIQVADRVLCGPMLIGEISGGGIAEAATHPWQAQIFSTYAYTPEEIAADRAKRDDDPGKFWLHVKEDWELRHRCGGVYIGQGWVLTAAHCVTKAGDFLKSRRIRLGTWDLFHAGRDFAVTAAAVHKDYGGDINVNDIALLKVALDGSDGALGLRPIRLHGSSRTDRPLKARDKVKVTGWGATRPWQGGALLFSPDGQLIRASSELKVVELEVRDARSCEAALGFNRPVPNSMICAGSDVAGDDSCLWDSGGPMTRIQGGTPVLVGLVSWGKGCGLPGMPAIYTRVSAYLPWIERAKKMSAGQVTRL